MRLVLAVVLLLVPADLHAHIVPRNNHDRTIVVRLEPGQEGVVARVEYRLELDEDTAIQDFAAYSDFPALKRNPRGFHGEFARIMGPIMARNLNGKAGGKSLEFTCRKTAHTLRDEKGLLLGHLRCDFTFEATLAAAGETTFTFEDRNFSDKEGKIDLSFNGAPGFKILSRIEPDEKLKNLPATERRPGDDRKLRSLSVRFLVSGGGVAAGTEPKTAVQSEPETPPADEPMGLLDLLVASDYGFLLLMVLSAWLGAIHALTPGHGKTLVAAYLVGEQGTVWHAFVLGLVTTLTHTGAAIILAVLFRLSYFDDIQKGVGLAMGLVVACLGFWLLLRRLAGQADHVHLGGGHHHHGHQHHPHEENGPRKTTVTWWGLVVLGMSGGIIPCWDAVAILGLGVSNQNWLALPMLLAFSAGLAAVLVLIGILVVKVRRFASSRWGEGRLIRSLPIVSALFVIAMGVWLCYESVQGGRVH